MGSKTKPSDLFDVIAVSAPVVEEGRVLVEKTVAEQGFERERRLGSTDRGPMPENLDWLGRRNGTVAVIHDPSRFLKVLRQLDSN